MTSYEYKVVPAPRKGQRAKGLRSLEQKFANALQGVMNELGSDGWEYLRAESLPCDARSGLGARTTSEQHALVFRRSTEATAIEHLYSKVSNNPAPAVGPAPVVSDGTEQPLSLGGVSRSEAKD